VKSSFISCHNLISFPQIFHSMRHKCHYFLELGLKTSPAHIHR
jgi:hypothetical protein